MGHGNLNEALEALERNPIFQLSLASKELFHSNFIAWLATIAPGQVGDYFAQFLPEGEKLRSTELSDVKREPKNFDLLFEWEKMDENPIYLVVENKVKSLPRKDQLKEYWNKAPESSSCLLLKLGEDPFIGEGNGTNWKVIQYKDLRDNLIEQIIGGGKGSLKGNGFSEEEKETSIRMLKQYGVFIDALGTIAEYSKVKELDPFPFFKQMPQKIQELRLHDLYLKRKNDWLLSNTIDRLEEDSFQILKEEEFVFAKADGNQRIGVYPSKGFTHGEGLVDVKYAIGNTAALGIQIQGGRFGLVLEKAQDDERPKEAEQVSERLLKEGKWFDFREFDEKFAGQIEASKDRWSHEGKPKNHPLFNSYGNTFFYRYKKVPGGTPVRELIDVIASYMHRIKRDYEELYGIIYK